MATQKDEILKMVAALKTVKFPVSKIETELGFSNGLIGKAAKGGTELSTEKFDKLVLFFNEKCGVNTNADKPKMGITEKENTSDKLLKDVRTLNDKINKDFGAGTVMLFGDKPQTGYDVISTGSLCLDRAVGIGGFPRGRIVEIYGLESSGKTTIALQVIANAQKQGLKCLLVDAENSFDPEYAEALGVKINELNYCQPSYGEEGLEVADRQIVNGNANVVVIDSVAALIPKRELEGEMGDSVMGLQARLMSQACRKMVTSVSKTNSLLIFINQIRNKIGVIYGTPEVVCGGMALQFYASIRVRVSKMATIKDGEELIGNRTKVKVVKNKCAPPMKTAEFDINYGEGVDSVGELIDLGTESGIIQKSGSWYSYDNNKLGQGRDGVKQLLIDNPDLISEIKAKLIDIVFEKK
jgi:recombination protein RecA